MAGGVVGGVTGAVLAQLALGSSPATKTTVIAPSAWTACLVHRAR